jgi:hypothetical protein
MKDDLLMHIKNDLAADTADIGVFSIIGRENYDVIEHSDIHRFVFLRRQRYLIHTTDDLYIPLKDFLMESNITSFVSFCHNLVEYGSEIFLCNVPRRPSICKSCSSIQCQQYGNDPTIWCDYHTRVIDAIEFIFQRYANILPQEKLLYLKLIL